MYNYNLQRHLKTCIKNKFCPICQKDISEGSINEHVEECGKTYYPCNVCGKRFNTATKRTTHEMNIKNSKVKADFQSKAILLTKAEIIEEEVKSHCNIVHDKIEEYYKRRNAREIVDIKSIDIMMADYS